jgi:ribonuclease P protein component
VVFLFRTLTFFSRPLQGVQMLKPNVLRKKKDFSEIYNRGKSIGERYVVLFIRKNNLDYNRTAFLASRKVGNSVSRNRARRLMKESYRALEKNLEKGYDLIWIARNTIVDLKCADVKKSMEAALKKSGIKSERADG